MSSEGVGLPPPSFNTIFKGRVSNLYIYSGEEVINSQPDKTIISLGLKVSTISLGLKVSRTKGDFDGF